MQFEEAKDAVKKYLVYLLGVHEIQNILRVILTLNYARVSNLRGHKMFWKMLNPKYLLS